MKEHILRGVRNGENSDGFRNAELARRSPGRSIDEAQRGRALKKAIAERAAVR